MIHAVIHHELDAIRVLEVALVTPGQGFTLKLENGDSVKATQLQTERFTPLPGDYWVSEPDGFSYISPKNIFERKYKETGGISTAPNVYPNEPGMPVSREHVPSNEASILKPNDRPLTKEQLETRKAHVARG